MIVQVVQEIDRSVKVVEETTTYSESQSTRISRVIYPGKATRHASGSKVVLARDSRESLFNVPSPNLRLANLIGPMIGLLKTFSSHVSRCEEDVRYSQRH